MNGHVLQTLREQLKVPGSSASTGQRYFIVIVYAASGSPLGSRVFSSRRPPSCFPLVDCCWTCVSLKDSCIEACVCLPH